MLASLLLDRASRRTGLMITGSERTDALQALNDVYLEAIMDARLNLTRNDFTIVTAGDIQDVDDLANQVPLGLAGVGRVSSSRYEPFQIVSHDELLENQMHSTSGEAVMVAPLGVTKLMFWPDLAVGDVIRTYFLPAVTALTDAAVEIPIVPAQFHQSVLLAGTIVQMLDKDQRKADVEFWGQRYEAGKLKMKLWADEFMGESTRMFNSNAGRVITTWPDERRRGV